MAAYVRLAGGHVIARHCELAAPWSGDRPGRPLIDDQVADQLLGMAQAESASQTRTGELAADCVRLTTPD
jgi:hypothetical protein